jgi:cyclin-dependent kinase regulatory subunit CKS1
MAHITYSDIYSDDVFDYRHVIMPTSVVSKVRALIAVPRGFLTEEQWRSVGVQMSKGWVHYSWHQPELNLLLFRRPKKNVETPNATPTKEEGEEPSEPEKPRKVRTVMKIRGRKEEEEHRTEMKVGDDDKKLTSSMKKLRLSPHSSSEQLSSAYDSSSE